MLSGSSILQITTDTVWSDSDLDVVTVGINPNTREMHELIHRLTIPPLNYEITRTMTTFHHTYLRLNRDVHTIVCFKHPDPDLPRIQIIFTRMERTQLYDFTHKYDIRNCEGYFDGKSLCKPDMTDVSKVLQVRNTVLSRQQVREWIRYFRRIVKYQARGMTLSRASAFSIFFISVTGCSIGPVKNPISPTIQAWSMQPRNMC